MARLLLALLIAFALLPASAVASPVQAQECMMMDAGSAIPDSHDGDCCMRACVMLTAAAMLPAQDANLQEVPSALLAPSPIPQSALLSTNPAADDPPPRQL